MDDNYAIAWKCLLICLRNNYPLDIWICPIPEEHKEKMIEGKDVFGGWKLFRPLFFVLTCSH